MVRWEELSMPEKAEMMKVAIRNGITTLPEIKQAYREFAEGVDISTNETNTYNVEGNLFKKGGSKKKATVNPAAQRAMRYFMDKGLTDYQAAGLVGNLMRESGMNPNAVNGGSQAYGLAQWLGPRKKALFSKYGNNPTFENQLDFIWSELNSTHRNGLKHIKASKSAEEAARNAMGYYEFSVGPAGAIANMKKYGQDGEGSMMKGIGFASSLMGQPVPTSFAYSDSQQLPITETIPQEDFSFTPMNPQVFGLQIPTYQTPVIVPEQPLVVMAEQTTPTPEQIDRQRIMQERAEQRDALNRFGLLMSMSNPQQGNDMMGAISMLSGNTFAKGGGIHIKPSHRGRFTELKERTGHSASWFKEHGTPAQKKMATFELNARHWKHGYGGNLYDGISQPTQQMNNSYTYYKPLENIFVDSEGNLRDPEVPRASGSILLPEVTSAHPDLKDMAGRYNIASNDAITVANGRPVNMHLRKAVDEGTKKQAAWAQEHPYLNMAGLVAGSAPLAVAAAPAVVGGGELAATALANPYVDKGIISAFAGHGLNHAINEGIDGCGDAAITALELAPLGGLVKPVVGAAVPLVEGVER